MLLGVAKYLDFSHIYTGEIKKLSCKFIREFYFLSNLILGRIYEFTIVKKCMITVITFFI